MNEERTICRYCGRPVSEQPDGLPICEPCGLPVDDCTCDVHPPLIPNFDDQSVYLNHQCGCRHYAGDLDAPHWIRCSLHWFIEQSDYED